MKAKTLPGLLLVANWDSAVGYAWWLMESYWVLLAKRYNHTHEIHLAYPTISKLPENIASAPINTHTIDFTATAVIAVLKQLQFLSLHRIKCIYLADGSSWHWRYFFYRLVGVKKIIMHDHTPGVRTQPDGIKRLVKRAVQNIPYITVDGLIGATEFIRSRHINVLCASKSKCYVAPNGLPINKVAPAIDVREHFNIQHDKKIIVMAARAQQYKGVDFALRCIAELVHLHHRTDLHFLYCGDGPSLTEFKSLCAKLEAAKFVTFAGHCDNIETVLKDCNLAIQPSQGEVGYSLSILEYMRAGLPTIVPDNPSVCGATAHGETGLIYSNGNVADAVNAILTLLDNARMREEMGASAMKKCGEFTLVKSHEALLKAFDQIYEMR